MNVLFICKGNYFRSQMAAAIYNQLTKSRDATSAGTYTGAPDEPEGRLLSEVMPNDAAQFKIMDEHGMDMRGNRTRRLTPQMLHDADIVISMAEEPYVPKFLRDDKRVIWWNIANPPSASLDFVRETYDKLEKLIRDLIYKK